MKQLEVLYWNVYVGQKAQAVRNELLAMTKTHKPELVVLGEASKAYAITDDISGYRRIHKAPKRYRGNESADTAVLVRADVPLRAHRFVTMLMRWRVPGRTVVHDPRTYIVTRIRWQGVTWRVYGAHWPFGKAQEETKARVRRWFRNSLRRLPSIHVGDLNARVGEIDAWAATFGAKRVGERIDHAVFTNCAGSVKNLGLHGSDHPALLFRFTKP